jgi:hypothetical protein
VVERLATFFFPSRLDPVLDGGGRDEHAVITPEVPSGIAVGQAIFGDQTDGPLLDTAGVLAVGQSQVGEIDGEATTTAEAAMAGESDHHIDGAFGPGIAEVMKGARVHGIATGAMATTRARSGWPVAAAPFDERLRQVFDTSNALGDIRDILTWTNHGYSPDARGVWSLSYANLKNRQLH